MLKFGEEPFLECSSKGDKRFSAFYARVENGTIRSIEDWYQGFKRFEDGGVGLSWREAKGRVAINQSEARKMYSWLWDVYFRQNPELYDVIKQYRGFSDIFGQEGHACQAEEIYRIRKEMNELDNRPLEEN